MLRVVIDDEPIDRVAVFRRLLAQPDETADDQRRGHLVTQPGDPGRRALVPRLQTAALQHHLAAHDGQA